MSRIGKLPVNLPTGVTAELLAGNVVKVKGPHGEMTQKVDPDITVTIEDVSHPEGRVRIWGRVLKQLKGVS